LLVDDSVELVFAQTIAALLASVPVTPVVVGIDILIGLPDAGPRQADGPRGASRGVVRGDGRGHGAVEVPGAG